MTTPLQAHPTPLYNALLTRNWSEAKQLIRQGAELDQACCNLILDLNPSLTGRGATLLKKAIRIKCQIQGKL